nr:hypothetical protein [Hymenobacter cellulosilyticus]
MLQVGGRVRPGCEISFDEAPGIVDQDIEVPKPLRYPVEQAGPVRRLGHIGLDGQCIWVGVRKEVEGFA